MSERKRARELTEKQAVDLLRGRLLGGIHSTHLAPGDRLPSYREIADETGLDLRAVTRVYEALQGDGLVEVRGRSGVFVAPQGRIGERVLEETARWFVRVLGDAWNRRIHLPDFPEFARQCISGVDVKCACIESTEDQLHWICTDLFRDFGIRSRPVHTDRLVAYQAASELTERVPPEIRDADFLVTTAFHGPMVRGIARSLDKPLVVLHLSRDLVRDLERRLDDGQLTVLCVDPRFLERMRLVFADRAEGIRGVLAEDVDAIRRLPSGVAVHITPAAYERVGKLNVPLLFPPNRPVMARESASEIVEMLVRINIRAMKDPK